MGVSNEPGIDRGELGSGTIVPTWPSRKRRHLDPLNWRFVFTIGIGIVGIGVATGWFFFSLVTLGRFKKKS